MTKNVTWEWSRIPLLVEWAPYGRRPWYLRRADTGDILRDLSRLDNTQPAYLFASVEAARAFAERLRKSKRLRLKCGLEVKS